MKRILFLLSFSMSMLLGAGQYNPAQHTQFNKSVGIAQAVPTDARSYFYDATLFKYRPYQSVAEVNAYLNITKYRVGHFPVFINIGGSLQSNGTFTGGELTEYWYKDGTANSNLVPKSQGSSGTSNVVMGTIAQLRAMSVNPSTLYFSTDITGQWADVGVYDSQFNDDGALHIVTANNRVLERKFTGSAIGDWFGVVHNGIANDSAAMQNAINICQSNNIDLHFPKGRYRFLGSLKTTNKIKITGVVDSTIFLPVGNGKTGLSIDAAPESFGQSGAVTVEGITMDGTSDPNGIGFHLAPGLVVGSGGVTSRIYLTQCKAINFQGSTKGWGIYINNTVYCTIDLSHFRFNNYGMIGEGNATSGYDGTPTTTSFKGCSFSQNLFDGAWVKNGYEYSFTDWCSFESNFGDGLKLGVHSGGAIYNTLVQACHFENNNRSTTDPSARLLKFQCEILGNGGDISNVHIQNSYFDLAARSIRLVGVANFVLDNNYYTNYDGAITFDSVSSAGYVRGLSALTGFADRFISYTHGASNKLIKVESTSFGGLTTNSGLKIGIDSLYSNTLVDGKYATILVNATTGNKIMTLLSAPAMNGAILTIQKSDTSTNAVTIVTSGTEKINGLVAPYYLISQNQSVQLQYNSDGGNWKILNQSLSFASNPNQVSATNNNGVISFALPQNINTSSLFQVSKLGVGMPADADVLSIYTPTGAAASLTPLIAGKNASDLLSVGIYARNDFTNQYATGLVIKVWKENIGPYDALEIAQSGDALFHGRAAGLNAILANDFVPLNQMNDSITKKIADNATVIVGTNHQVKASNPIGTVTLTLPQDVDSTSNIQFNRIGLGTAGFAAPNYPVTVFTPSGTFGSLFPIIGSQNGSGLTSGAIFSRNENTTQYMRGLVFRTWKINVGDFDALEISNTGDVKINGRATAQNAISPNELMTLGQYKDSIGKLAFYLLNSQDADPNLDTILVKVNDSTATFKPISVRAGSGVSVSKSVTATHIIYTVTASGLATTVLPEFANNAAAIDAGYRNGEYYRTGDVVKQVHDDGTSP